MTPPLLLASASPRRAELLRQLGVPFEQRAMETDETPLPGEPAAALVRRLALGKAVAALPLAARGQWVLGADTVVVLGNHILGKPADAADASAMLSLLSGRVHRVYTGIALLREGHGPLQACPCTRVGFRELGEAEIAAYVATGEPLGKAGAYAIQGRAAAFVRGIAGSWSNVVGLPLFELDALLRRLPDPPPRD
jgi:septum formation protein